MAVAKDHAMRHLCALPVLVRVEGRAHEERVPQAEEQHCSPHTAPRGDVVPHAADCQVDGSVCSVYHRYIIRTSIRKTEA